MTQIKPKSQLDRLLSEVVIKVRDGKVKTTEQRLAACQSEMFDGFLRGGWKQSLDRKGRRELNLSQFSAKEITDAIAYMSPDEQREDTLVFLSHQPTVNRLSAAKVMDRAGEALARPGDSTAASAQRLGSKAAQPQGLPEEMEAETRPKSSGILPKLVRFALPAALRRRLLEPGATGAELAAAGVLTGLVKVDDALEYYPDSREVALAAVTKDGNNLEYVPEFQADREVVMRAVRERGSALRFADPMYRADRDVVMCAVHSTGSSIGYASSDLRADRELAKIAVSQSSNNGFNCIDPALRSDRELVLLAVTCAGKVLKDVPPIMQNDREVVMRAVAQYPLALEYASDALRADREVVMRAVEQYPPALKYASDTLRADREVVMHAISRPGIHYFPALEFASEALRSDPEIVLRSIQHDGASLRFASDNLRNDDKLARIAAQQVGWTLSGRGKPQTTRSGRKEVMLTVQGYRYRW